MCCMQVCWENKVVVKLRSAILLDMPLLLLSRETWAVSSTVGIVVHCCLHFCSHLRLYKASGFSIRELLSWDTDSQGFFGLISLGVQVSTEWTRYLMASTKQSATPGCVELLLHYTAVVVQAAWRGACRSATGLCFSWLTHGLLFSDRMLRIASTRTFSRVCLLSYSCSSQETDVPH